MFSNVSLNAPPPSNPNPTTTVNHIINSINQHPWTAAASTMAKLSSSARTPARQKSSTPQPQPAATAPGRQTRTTRGQSREPSEPPTPRRSGRNARGASVDSDAGATTRGRNSKTAAVANGKFWTRHVSHLHSSSRDNVVSVDVSQYITRVHLTRWLRS